MRKEIQPVPKNIQPILLGINNFIVSIIEQVYGDKSKDSVLEALNNNQTTLVNLLLKAVVSRPNKTKELNAPKRAKSSYIYFCVDQRENVKTTSPDSNAKEIIKELGRMWREDVSEEMKKKYSELSEKDKIRYEEEMTKYTLTMFPFLEN